MSSNPWEVIFILDYPNFFIQGKFSSKGFFQRVKPYRDGYRRIFCPELTTCKGIKNGFYDYEGPYTAAGFYHRSRRFLKNGFNN